MNNKAVHRDVLERYCSHAGENVILIKKTDTLECLCPHLCGGKNKRCKYVRIHEEQKIKPTR